jgi:superfamily II DNA or RNA helicase
MQPRAYQIQCVDSVLSGFSEHNKQLAVLPTGAGKSCVFSWIAQRVLPKRTLILAHREELIDQAIEKLHRSTGIFADKEKAEFRASLNAQVVVGSVQTLQGNRLGRWPQDHFGLVVVDEAHHVLADSYRRTLAHFEASAWVLGVTATPDRGDKRNLGSYFENIAAEVTLFDLINQGFLSRICVQSVPVEVDLSKVRQTAGDYNEADLGDALAPYLRSIALAIKEHAAFRRTLVFLPLCATSREFVRICNEEGISAAHVDGNSEDRKEILARFAAGEFDLLSNSMLLTEGYDDPGIDCVVILRPTKSRSLYSQMVGRGTRVAPTKSNLLLLDLLWLHEKHNLIRPAHLIASNDEQARIITELVTERSSNHGAVQESLDLEGLASEAQIKREKRLREEIHQKAKKGSKTVDAMEWCINMGEHDLVDYEPTMPWESNALTEKQGKILKRAGIDLATVKGMGHASKLIGAFFNHQKTVPASAAQRALMQRMGHQNWHNATADEARKFFAGLKRQAA